MVLQLGGSTGVTLPDGTQAVSENDLFPAIEGSATFTNATNNIALTDIGLISTLEVGDVIQIGNSLSNNGEYTVEVITDDNNVIVNQAHAGGTTSKSLTNETATSGVTVKLLAKWFVAPIGLGQGWVDLNLSRTAGSPYTNATGRPMYIALAMALGTTASTILTVDSETSGSIEDPDAGSVGALYSIVPNQGVYSINATGNIISRWAELR